MQKIHNLHNWISELPEEVAREVRQCFTTRTLISGEYLYRQGDAPTACFQVAKGRLKVCNVNVNGQELVHTFLKEGDCVGDWGLLIQEPRMNYAVSCGPSVINVLRQGDFSRLYEAYPDIPKALNRVMAYRLRLIFMLSEDSSLLPLHDRLARAVVRLGHTFGERGDNREVVITGISHEDLARMVGATRPSVGRELKKLQKDGSLEISYGKLIIKDMVNFSEKYDHLLSVEPVTPDYQDLEN